MSVSQATAAGQGAGDPGTGAGEPQGTAQGGQEQSGQFNWGPFPGIPEEVRPQLEPHLKGIQSYITKREMEFAPFKPLVDAGFDSETIQGVMNFTSRMQQDPVNTVFALMEELQQAGQIDADLDLESVKLVASGQPLPGEEPGGGGDIIEQPPGGGQDGEIPEWGQQLMQAVGQLVQMNQTEQQRRQQGAQDRLLNQTMDNLRNSLSEAKLDLKAVSEDPAVQDRWLTSLLITHNMDVNAAAQAAIAFRDNSVQAFTQETTDNDPTQRELELPRGAPGSRPKPRGGDAFAQAQAGARSMLESRMRADAQGS